MERLNKKCFFGSAVLHSLLLLCVVVGAAFIKSKPNDEVIAVEIVDLSNAVLVDAPSSGGGGGGNPAPPPETRRAPERIRENSPKPSSVETVKPIVKLRETPKVETPLKNEPESVSDEPAPVARPKKTEIKVNLNPVVKTETKKVDHSREDARAAREAKAQAEEAEREDMAALAAAEKDRRERAEMFSNIGSRLGKLQSGLASSTGIEMPGGGATGPAYVNYSLAIKKLYEEAWRTPEEADSSTAVAEIVIARDGKVVSSRIVKKSSSGGLDRSVKELLNRIKKVPPFPEGATDTVRTFKINFNLKSKTQIG